MGHHSVADARNNFSELLARAERGEEVVITRHGSPVARLSSIVRDTEPDKRLARERLMANSIKPIAGPVDSAELVREMRDEGY